MGVATAIVVGLVAVTPAAGYISPVGAIALGVISSVPSFILIRWRTRTKLDDSLDVFAAHGVGGISGALLTGVFASAAFGGNTGLFDGNAAQVGIQAVSILAVAAYSAIATFLLLKFIGLFAPLRTDADSEGLGMDISAHGEEAYATGEGAVLLNVEETPEHVNGLMNSN